MSDPYYTVKDPDGHLCHTHVSLSPEEAIEDFLDTEQSMMVIVNCGRAIRGEYIRCTESWESYEAEGYSVVPALMVEQPSCDHMASYLTAEGNCMTCGKKA